MIKTYLKYFILDKFINHLFDGFIDTFHKPVNFYTQDDFYIGQKINTFNNTFNHVLTSGYIVKITTDYIIINYVENYITDSNDKHINTYKYGYETVFFNKLRYFD